MKQHNTSVKRMLLFTLLALGACFMSIEKVSATHAYGGQLKWQQAGGNKIQFTFTSTWRRSFFGAPTVGQTISGIGNINTGNGVSLPIVATVTAVDALNDQLYATWSGTHTYTTTGNFIAQWDLCCRISSLQDGNNDQNTRFQTIVNVGPPYNNPPVSALPNIVFLPVGQSAATLSIPGSDPDGNNITYRLSTSAESSLITAAPAGFSLASNGVVTMNTTTRTVNQRFGVQVMIEDGSTKTPVDFIIQMVGSSAPPFFVAPTPMPPNNNITVLPGNNVTFTIAARDDDANSTVKLNPIALPTGASIAPVLPITGALNSTVSATFSWTPTSAQVGNYVLTFPAVDNVGVQALNTVNITVSCALDAQLTSSFVNCGTNINASVTNFSNTSNLLYTWSGPNGFTANTQNITNVAPGTYSLRVNDIGTGCLVVKNITVASSVPAPTITANGSTSICPGSSVGLTASAGTSYLWSNGATTQSINVSTPGNYTVTVTNASGCQSTSAVTTVSYKTGLDTDGDGIPDSCDADDDNDGIPDAVECNKSNFFWSNPPTVSGNTATGVINGVSYTYTSSRTVETTPSVYAHNVFPTSYGIPNIQCIKNVFASNNTLTFATPVTNPVLVFSSIGNPGLYVPIEFSAPIDILWSTDVVKNSSTRITGNEGYAVIRLNGTFSSISFNYLADENWVNFLFGADFQTCGDTDGDGTPDKLDTDSDNDGCPDAIEGSQNPTMAQTANGRLTGGVDANGIPTLVNGGQGLGTSQNANVNCFCQVGIDKTAPVITCPANITLNATSASGAVVNYTTPTATDDCAVTITRTAGFANGATFPIGTTTVTHTATDAAGNVSTCSFTVTVTGLPPQIVSPGNQTASAAAGTCGAVVNFTATETTAIPASTISYSHQPGSVFPVGVTTVTATATNPVGSSSVTFTVTVTDNENPTIGGLSAITVNADNGSCAATGVALGTPVTGDNCGVASVTNNAPASYPVGNTTVTWTVTDIHGNSTTTTQVVTVRDNQNPTIGGLSAITVNADNSSCAAANVALGTPVTGDNCGVASVSNNAPASYPVGNTTVTWTVTDIHGNSTTTTQVVTVRDNQNPTIGGLSAITVNADNGACAATNVALGTPVTGDNCGVASVTNNAPASFPVGNTTVTWTVTDIHGNSTTTTQVVTVKDNQAPTVRVNNVTVTLVNGSASVNAAQINNGSSDNCGVSSVVLSGKMNYSCADIGQHTVTLTVTDIHGNVASANAVVTVVGVIPSASITAVPSNNTFTGGVPTNLYLGYGPQSLTLQVNAAGGAPYSYSWTGNGTLSSTTSASPVFTATVAGNYTFVVTVTNVNGCTTTARVSICVRDIRVPGTNGNSAKVYLCHVPPGNAGNPQTLSISVNAVASHLTQHSGDRLGTCGMLPCGVPSSIAGGEIEAAKVEIEDHANELDVIASPNPTMNYFELLIQSADKTTPVQVRVTSMNGRVLTAVKATVGQKVRFGQEYTSGTYVAEAIQGNKRKTVKLIKGK